MIDGDLRSKAFLSEADKNLELAKEELMKPSEDLLGFSVCKNSQFAIENYLKGFLLKNNIEISMEDTMASLYDKCENVDPDFKTIEMSAIACKGNTIDARYCTDINTVSACFDTADTIDTFLRKKSIL
jgi:HEPN domain-containing protein